MSNLCSVCETRPAVFSAPRGWDAERNTPASAPECLRCAIQDGWHFADQDGYMRLPDGRQISYSEWNPSKEEIDLLVEYEEAKRKMEVALEGLGLMFNPKPVAKKY